MMKTKKKKNVLEAGVHYDTKKLAYDQLMVLENKTSDVEFIVEEK